MTYRILNELKASGLPTEVDWLVVGLGNPGKRYEATRHNIGFLVLDALFPDRYKPAWQSARILKAEWTSTIIDNKKLLLVKPQTFMNLSGEAVGPLVKALELPMERVLVVVDEVALPYGKVRVRSKGSAGGQNGMKSIIKALGNQEDFPRVRVGIGPQPDRLPLEAFVLQPFSAEERGQLSAVIQLACEAITCCIAEGVEATPQRVNGKIAF